MAASTLALLAPGQSGIVRAVDTGSAIGERLLDLGFVPGTAVRAMARAPLGDPTIYAVRGALFCLRRSEAARIEVDAEADLG